MREVDRKQIPLNSVQFFLCKSNLAYDTLRSAPKQQHPRPLDPSKPNLFCSQLILLSCLTNYPLQSTRNLAKFTVWWFDDQALATPSVNEETRVYSDWIYKVRPILLSQRSWIAEPHSLGDYTRCCDRKWSWKLAADSSSIHLTDTFFYRGRLNILNSLTKGSKVQNIRPRSKTNQSRNFVKYWENVCLSFAYTTFVDT